MPTSIRLLVADDNEIFRDGLVLMLSRQPHFILEGQAENGQELIRMVQEKQPDIVLTDIKMPRMDGIEATRHIRAHFPQVYVIALSMYDEENLIVDMLEAGARGYLLKNADKQEILEAIESVYQDKEFYCQHTSARLAAMIVKSKFNPHRKTEIIEFTDREKDIVKLICLQCTAQEIADKLYLSKRTVEGYRTRILEKMNVKNTAGVVIYALKHGIIRESDILE